MTELSKEQIERRAAKAMTGLLPVTIPGLDGLFFRPLTLAEKGHVSRAYTTALLANQKAGMPSKYALPTLLKQAVEASGLSMSVLARKGALYKKQLDALSEDLLGPYDQLTPDEIAELPAEEKQGRAEAIEARGRRIVEVMSTSLTGDDREALQQIEQIEQIEQHLRLQTAEHRAEQEQTLEEILKGAVRSDGAPFFASKDDLEALEPMDALADLFIAWMQFKNGQHSDFFSRS